MDNNNNLPIKVNNGLSLQSKRNIRRVGEKFKNIGKVSLDLGILLAGIGVMGASTVPALTLLGAGIFTVGGTKAIKKTVYKKYDDMLFLTRKNLKGEREIFQDLTDMRGLKIMKDFKAGEKAALMGMQTLVGLQRYKQEAEDLNQKKVPIENKDYNAYNTVFSTVTHGINIKTFRALNDLGYINIDSLEDKVESNLTLEKLTFGQLKVKDTIKNMLKKDLSAEKVKMQKIKFRLTDKPFDLEQLYSEYMELKASKDINNKARLEKVDSVVRIMRLLKRRNIDIERDKVGMLKINYHADKSFADRMEVLNPRKQNKFLEELKVDQSIGREPQLEKDKGQIEQLNNDLRGNRNISDKTDDLQR